jgi:hypothetical protein
VSCPTCAPRGQPRRAAPGTARCHRPRRERRVPPALAVRRTTQKARPTQYGAELALAGHTRRASLRRDAARTGAASRAAERRWRAAARAAAQPRGRRSAATRARGRRRQAPGGQAAQGCCAAAAGVRGRGLRVFLIRAQGRREVRASSCAVLCAYRGAERGCAGGCRWGTWWWRRTRSRGSCSRSGALSQRIGRHVWGSVAAAASMTIAPLVSHRARFWRDAGTLS